MGVLAKLAISAIVLVLMVPGLIIEPGPLTEVAGIGILTAIWLGDEVDV